MFDLFGRNGFDYQPPGDLFRMRHPFGQFQPTTGGVMPPHLYGPMTGGQHPPQTYAPMAGGGLPPQRMGGLAGLFNRYSGPL